MPVHQPTMHDLGLKAAVAIDIAEYGSKDMNQIEETATELMGLSLEALKSVRTRLKEYKARNLARSTGQCP